MSYNEYGWKCACGKIITFYGNDKRTIFSGIKHVKISKKLMIFASQINQDILLVFVLHIIKV